MFGARFCYRHFLAGTIASEIDVAMDVAHAPLMKWTSVMCLAVSFVLSVFAVADDQSRPETKDEEMRRLILAREELKDFATWKGKNGKAFKGLFIKEDGETLHIRRASDQRVLKIAKSNLGV